MASLSYSYPELLRFTEDIFKAIGCSPKEASLAAKVLLSADLRGIDSHGVARLSGYVRLWEAKRINTRPKMAVVHETPSTAVLDADAALGLVSGPSAIQLAIQKAQVCGTGWVAVKNSNHFGIAGYHAMQALPHNMIGLAMTNASPLVAPTHATERMLGTNPIAVAVPAREEPAFVADFATTTAANGKLEILQRKQSPTPTGWVQDARGSSSIDPNELKHGGALLPLGSDLERGSHKGYCLGSIVDIFSGVLSGANYGPWVPPFVAFLPVAPNLVGEGIGHFFGAMRVDAFRPAEEFLANMDTWIRRFRSAKTVEGQAKVLIPGDPERETEALRLTHGIPLLAPVAEDLQQLTAKLSVNPLEPLVRR